MSQTQNHPEQPDGIEPDDPHALVEEHRDLIEKIANADVALSERCQRVLDEVDGDDDE